MEMRILDRRDFHIRILINHAGHDVVRVENSVMDRRLPSAPADFRVRRQIIDRALDQRFDAATVDVDRLGRFDIPIPT